LNINWDKEMQYEFKEVRAGDINLAFIEQGRGVPVIFVHGSGPTDLRTWGQQIEPFAEHFHVITYSQRCHYPNAWIGNSTDICSTSVNASDLAAMIVALQLGRVHLVGSSFGADIALRLVVDRPELVRTLVVVEPALFSWLATLPGGIKLFNDFAATMIPAKKAAQDGDFDRGLRLFIDAALGNGVYDQLPPSVQDRLMANKQLVSVEPTEISEMVTDITRDDASTIRTPTLILTGDGSPKMYLLVSQELARYLPNAEQAQIGGAAHLLHVMNPQGYNAAPLAFLATHTSYRRVTADLDHTARHYYSTSERIATKLLDGVVSHLTGG
jgi:pimeloyl-ACP methyl ester carboxylesterase